MDSLNHPVKLRIYIFSWKLLQKILLFLNICFIGFWIGILKREDLHLIDEWYYNDADDMYIKEEYNQRGFWQWEGKALNKYFQNCRCLLVAGSGGGREILALRKLGYIVDGFECNPKLLEFANQLMRKEGFDSNLQLALRDRCPSVNKEKEYDGIIIGWGSYMLIQGRERRIAFLKNLKTQTKPKSPLLLSFFYCSGSRRYFKLVAKIGNIIRWFLRRELTEIGDALAPNYVHSFTKEEIADELKEGGFELEFYCTDDYGHAIGIAD